MAGITIVAILMGVAAAFFIGASIGYAVGKIDGEKEVAEHYERKARRAGVRI